MASSPAGPSPGKLRAAGYTPTGTDGERSLLSPRSCGGRPGLECGRRGIRRTVEVGYMKVGSIFNAKWIVVNKFSAQ